jgi:hypothetical protein
MEATGRHEQQPLQLESSDEEENSSQQVNFVTDPKDDDELFEMAKSKKSSWGAKRKRDLLKAFSVKNPRHLFDKSFSERTDVQELFALFNCIVSRRVKINSPCPRTPFKTSLNQLVRRRESTSNGQGRKQQAATKFVQLSLFEPIKVWQGAKGKAICKILKYYFRIYFRSNCIRNVERWHRKSHPFPN